MTFAKDTTVSAEKSRVELEQVLARYRATQRFTGVDEIEGVAVVGFTIQERQVKVRVPLPTRESVLKTTKKPRDWWSRNEDQKRAWADRELDQHYRSRWRVLVLLVKAKLEAVELGISTIEREFLADIMLPDGRSVHRALADDLEKAYRTGAMPPLLGSGS